MRCITRAVCCGRTGEQLGVGVESWTWLKACAVRVLGGCWE